MSNGRTNHFSNKLIYTQLILSILVVLIHIFYSSPKYQDVILSNNTWSLLIIGDIITNFAQFVVPAFFTISAFLFYYKFNYSKLIEKYKRRIHSLIIPFLIWNTLIYFFWLYVSEFPFIDMEPMVFSIKAMFLSVFNSTNNPLWYIRTLIVYFLISPIIICLWKNKVIPVLFIVLFIILTFLKIQIPIISFYYLPFFLVGAYMAIYFPEEIVMSLGVSKKKKIFGVIGMIICLIMSCFIDNMTEYSFLYLYRIIGTISFWFALDMFDFNTEPREWQKHSFFIYCMHSPIVRTIKSYIYFYLPKTVPYALLNYVLCFIVTVALIGFVALLLRRYFYQAWVIINGSR